MPASGQLFMCTPLSVLYMMMVSSAMPNSSMSQAPPPPPPVPTWHLAENGEAVGPFSQSQLAEAVASGRMRADTLAWRGGMQGWTQAGELPELQSLFS